jgi:hypothetical protein
MQTDYTKIFSRSSLWAKKNVYALHEQGIAAMIKDEAESVRLSGFESSMLGKAVLYVFKDVIQLAETIAQQTQVQQKTLIYFS